jgi:hypothetical protein
VSVTILSMSTEQILALLIAARDKLNRAIEALQGPTKRRGRPPGNPDGYRTAVSRLGPGNDLAALHYELDPLQLADVG